MGLRFVLVGVCCCILFPCVSLLSFVLCLIDVMFVGFVVVIYMCLFVVHRCVSLLSFGCMLLAYVRNICALSCLCFRLLSCCVCVVVVILLCLVVVLMVCVLLLSGLFLSLPSFCWWVLMLH